MKTSVNVMIVFSWTFSLILALPPLFGWGSYRPEMSGMSCAPSWTRVLIPLLPNIDLEMTDALSGVRHTLQYLPLHPWFLHSPDHHPTHITGSHHQVEKADQQHHQP